MKTKVITLLVALMTIGQASAQPYADRDAHPDATRDAYLQRTYNMTDAQCVQYTQLLLEEYNALEELYATNISQTILDARKKELLQVFRLKVMKILTPSQYASWVKSCLTNRSRRYHEYLGLDNLQVLAINRIIKEYNANMKKRYSGLKIYSAVERAEMRQECTKNRNNALAEIIGSQAIDEFTHAYDLDRQARIIHRDWPFLSFKRAQQLAVVFLEHATVKDEILLSEEPLNIKRKHLSAENKKYNKAVQNLLSSEEYVKFIETDEARADLLLKRNYRMTNSQLAKYKDIMNYRAVERLAVKKSKLSKSEKQERYGTIDLNTKSKMEVALRPEQVDVWWRNLNKQR